MNRGVTFVGPEFLVDPSDGDASLHLAALEGDTTRLEWLLNGDAGQCLINLQLRPYQATPLRLATSVSNVECVRMLLEAGADVDLPDLKNQTPLFLAISNSDIIICKLLLEAGACPDGNERNLSAPIHIACIRGFAVGLRLLLDYGARIEGFSVHPLHLAAAYGHLNCFIILMLYEARTDLMYYGPSTNYMIDNFIKNRCPPQFLMLWVLAGGNPNLSTIQNIPFNLSEPLQRFKEQPLPLICLCRIFIRKMMRGRLSQLHLLDLPPFLIDFLQFKEIPEVRVCLEVTQTIDIR